jgi:hypothetical protein
VDWRKYVGPALPLQAKLVGLPWWTVLLVTITILSSQLFQFLLHRRRLELGDKALKKAEPGDVPAVTAAIMGAPPPDASEKTPAAKKRGFRWPWWR